MLCGVATKNIQLAASLEARGNFGVKRYRLSPGRNHGDLLDDGRGDAATYDPASDGVRETHSAPIVWNELLEG